VLFDFAESEVKKKMQVVRKQIFAANFLGGDDLLVVNSTTFLVAVFFSHQSFSRGKEYES